MGCFSWMFADKGNKSRLMCGHKGYIACPDGSFIQERCYEGYGRFDGQDVYELVVEWNREYLMNHPEHIMPKTGKAISEYSWYIVLSNPSIPTDMIAEEAKKRCVVCECFELRSLGIDIACYDDDNASLPYPIKITSRKGLEYNKLPASWYDKNQGC